MMLQHLGHQEAHDSIMTAIEDTLRERANLTPDMGGKANTEHLGKEIAAAIE
jgi:tartrate dehydrogenase/decarboxylase/D-malate dehydrogenase